jgi:hypothetical protein
MPLSPRFLRHRHPPTAAAGSPRRRLPQHAAVACQSGAQQNLRGLPGARAQGTKRGTKRETYPGDGAQTPGHVCKGMLWSIPVLLHSSPLSADTAAYLNGTYIKGDRFKSVPLYLRGVHKSVDITGGGWSSCIFGNVANPSTRQEPYYVGRCACVPRTAYDLPAPFQPQFRCAPVRHVVIFCWRVVAISRDSGAGTLQGLCPSLRMLRSNLWDAQAVMRGMADKVWRSLPPAAEGKPALLGAPGTSGADSLPST